MAQNKKEQSKLLQARLQRQRLLLGKRFLHGWNSGDDGLVQLDINF